MIGVIMAGGQGTRLAPLTCDMPKPMVPLLNKPVIDYCVELLKKHGINDIIATLHYLPEQIKKHLGDGSAFGVNMRYSVEDVPLGTAGSVRKAMSGINDTVLIISGDAITDVDLTEAMETHVKRGAKATIILKRVDIPTEYGVVLLDKQGRITRFLEKPMQSEVFSDLANTGIYIIEPEIINMIPEGTQFDFSRDLFPLVMENSIDIYGYETLGYWCDIGDTRQYLQAQFDMLDGKCSFKTKAANRDGIFLEPMAIVSPKARLERPCYIANDVQVAEGASVGAHSILCSGVKLFPDSSVERSVLMQNTILRNFAQIKGSIVCSGVHIKNNASIFEGAVIGSGTVLGENSFVSPNIAIWPGKKLSADSRIDRNLIWGECDIDLFYENELRGFADCELTPETAVRLGATVASNLRKEAAFAVATDGKPQSIMLKHAFVSGLISQSCDVYDTCIAPEPVLRESIVSMALDGGCYITCEAGDEHRMRIKLFDEIGAGFKPTVMRKLKHCYSKGEVKPVTDRELGVVTECVGGCLRQYELEALRMVNMLDMRRKRGVLMLDAEPNTFEIVKLLFNKCAWTVYGKNDTNCAVSETDSCIGISIDSSGTVSAAVDANEVLDEFAINTLFAMYRLHTGGVNRFVFPVGTPEAYLKYLEREGAEIIVLPQDKEKLRHTAWEEEIDMPELFDPVQACLRLAQMHASGALERLIENLPQTYSETKELNCEVSSVGRLLRSLVDSEEQGKLELVDGINIKSEQGWVLVKPRADGKSLKVAANSFNSEYAKDLADFYANRVKAILDKEKPK